ncbi:MAG: hypothetical protein J0M24_28005 [Verrucomicrobia bacterium]|nr:hypothetical protein [Verrucomicrobiota bacterium]
MPYALMQSRLEIPDREALRRAFRCGAGLTPMDAPHVARDAFGILLKNLTHEDAVTLYQALAREGIETELVDQADLPPLPDWKWVRRVGLRETGLVICDPLGRELEIPWENLALISAGLVWDSEFVKTSRPASGGADLEDDFSGLFAARALNAFGGVGPLGMPLRGPGIPLSSIPETTTQERQVWRWGADLFLKNVPLRFILRPDPLEIIQPEPITIADPTIRFLELIRSLSQHTPMALTNRVVYALREGHSDTLRYPSRNAYQEEMIWILWRLRQAGAAI